MKIIKNGLRKTRPIITNVKFKCYSCKCKFVTTNDDIPPIIEIFFQQGTNNSDGAYCSPFWRIELKCPQCNAILSKRIVKVVKLLY